MDFAKMNLFKKFREEIPVGLCSLGLKKTLKKQNKKYIGYPKFFRFDKVSPVGI